MLTNKRNTADVADKLPNKINSADMLPITAKGAHLLAMKTNSDVEMTDNGKPTKAHMVNDSQARTFIINDKTCETQSCVRACNLRTAFIRWWTSCMRFSNTVILMFTIMFVNLTERKRTI